MVTDSEIRAWARDTGRNATVRGRVSDELRADYDAAHNGHTTPADYPDGMDESMFADATEPDDLGDTGERRPGPVTPRGGRARAQATASRFGWRRSSKGKAGAKKKALPRVSTADLISSGWRILAKVAQPMPPLYRVTRLQGVIAGPMLEEATQGTVVDAVLQPLARMQARGEAIGALVLPPASIMALQVHLATAAKQEREPNPIITQVCLESLRHGLMAMMKVGGSKFAAALAREREEQDTYGTDVEALMEWILSPPGDREAEEEAIRRMGMRLAGEPDPEPAAA